MEEAYRRAVRSVALMGGVDNRIGHHFDGFINRGVQARKTYTLNYLKVECVSVLILRINQAAIVVLDKFNRKARLMAFVLQIAPENAGFGLAESF